MTLSFLAVGVGDAFSALSYSACLAIEAKGPDGEVNRLLIDCAHPVRKALREATLEREKPLDIGDFDALLLTHLHADHASGLEGWGFFHRFALGRQAKVLTHPQVKRDLWSSLSPSMGVLIERGVRQPKELETYFDVETFTDEIAVGPFRIECRTTWHHIPTIALRVHAYGRSLGYSADTAFDPALIEWLAKCDHVVHETNFGGAHTDYASLRELDPEIRKKMSLIAYPDGFESKEIALLRQGEQMEVKRCV